MSASVSRRDPVSCNAYAVIKRTMLRYKAARYKFYRHRQTLHHQLCTHCTAMYRPPPLRLAAALFLAVTLQLVICSLAEGPICRPRAQPPGTVEVVGMKLLLIN